MKQIPKNCAFLENKKWNFQISVTYTAVLQCKNDKKRKFQGNKWSSIIHKLVKPPAPKLSRRCFASEDANLVTEELLWAFCT